jgi:hypothetical protein
MVHTFIVYATIFLFALPFFDPKGSSSGAFNHISFVIELQRNK